MKNWLESIYSDGTADYISNPLPQINDVIEVSIRVYDNAPVKKIIMNRSFNGADHFEEMEKYKTKDGLAYYKCNMLVQQRYISYYFIIITEDKVYYYTQKEVTSYVPENTYCFKILAGYAQPAWVKGSVFYQIFPERFFNGNPENDVKDNEYLCAGHPTIQVKDWDSVPDYYEKSFCADFYGGDLEGVRKKIPYLKKLNVKAVYLNPIFYAPSVHKYDCLDYLTVDPHFGGDKALEELCSELHKNGMKIILDISINHTGASSKWFNKDCEFYDKSVGAYNNRDSKERKYYFFNDETNEYVSWYGIENMPTLNYTNQELRDLLYRSEDSVIKKWLKPPYSIDGWRFDVADVMCRNNELQLHHDVWPEIAQSIKSVNKNAYILAEDWGDCNEFLQGDEWDSPMNYFGCGRPVRQFVCGRDLIMDRNKDIASVKYKMTAHDLSERILEHFAKLPTVIQQVQFNLIDSHDAYRLHNDTTVTWEEYVGAVIMLFTLPGATSIYYGDEAGIGGRIEDTEGCRYPMPWNSDFEKTNYFTLYSTLTAIKNDSRALSDGGFKILNADNYVFAYARFTNDQVYIAICSTDPESRVITIPIDIFGVKHCDIVCDELGTPVEYKLNNEGDMLFTVKQHTSYLIKL